MTEKNVQQLLEIAARSITAHYAGVEVKRFKKFVDQAYDEWREENGVEYVVEHTPNWDKMLEATRDTYISMKSRKRAHYNAKRRLASAIKRLHFE